MLRYYEVMVILNLPFALEFLLRTNKDAKSHRQFDAAIKVAVSGLKQFLATESPLKMMKNAFYFTIKGLFVLNVDLFFM